ncbi:MAG: hypothetical protein RL208_686, partial [Pseudomonadota bacterium]
MNCLKEFRNYLFSVKNIFLILIVIILFLIAVILGIIFFFFKTSDASWVAVSAISAMASAIASFVLAFLTYGLLKDPAKREKEKGRKIIIAFKKELEKSQTLSKHFDEIFNTKDISDLFTRKEKDIIIKFFETHYSEYKEYADKLKELKSFEEIRKFFNENISNSKYNLLIFHGIMIFDEKIDCYWFQLDWLNKMLDEHENNHLTQMKKFEHYPQETKEECSSKLLSSFYKEYLFRWCEFLYKTSDLSGSMKILFRLKQEYEKITEIFIKTFQIEID